MQTHINYKCTKCGNLAPVKEIDPDHFECVKCKNIMSEEEIESGNRAQASLNRQNKIAAFVEKDYGMIPLGPDRFPVMAESLTYRISGINNLAKKLPYDWSEAEFQEAMKGLNGIIEHAKDMKAVLRGKRYSGKVWQAEPDEFMADEEQQNYLDYKQKNPEE